MTNSQLSSIDTIFIDIRSLHTHCFICTLCGLASTLSHPTSLYFYFVFEAWCYWEYCHPRFFSYLPISLLASIDITSWFFFPRTQKTMLGLKSSRSLNPQIIKPNFWNVRTSSFNFEICYDSSGANRSCLHMTALSYTELSSLILIWTPWTTYFWRLIKAKHLNYLKSLLH